MRYYIFNKQKNKFMDILSFETKKPAQQFIRGHEDTYEIKQQKRGVKIEN